MRRLLASRRRRSRPLNPTSPPPRSSATPSTRFGASRRRPCRRAARLPCPAASPLASSCSPSQRRRTAAGTCSPPGVAALGCNRLATPLRRVLSPLSRWLRREAERCQGCGAFRNLYVAVEAQTGRWMCNFCGHITTSDDLKGKDAIDACRELRDAVVRRGNRPPWPGVPGQPLFADLCTRRWSTSSLSLAQCRAHSSAATRTFSL